MKKVFRLSSYVGDDMARLQNACRDLRDNPGSTLRIEPGHYKITGETARKTMQDCIGGVYGADPEKTMFKPDFTYDVGLDLSDMTDVTVDARGVHFDVIGFMEPVSITRSHGVKVIGLTIDHVRKPYSRGLVVEVCPHEGDKYGYITVCFDDDEFPLDDGFPMPRWATYDEKLKRYVHYGYPDIYRRERVDENTWRFYGKNMFEDTLGCVFYAWHTFHSRPAVMIQDSADVVLKKVTIHSQPGMGVVAHRSKNLLFDGLAVVPSYGEYLSTNTDATHISSCSGDVIYKNCVFNGQGDDSLNVHTYYHTVREFNGNTCRLEMCAPTGTHSQKQDYPDVGDVLELTDPATLAVKGTYTVTECRRDGDKFVTVTLDRPVDTRAGDLFANATQCPHLVVERCRMTNHIARGVLVKTKWAKITRCVFKDIALCGIEVAAEAWWAEGLCSTENIEITKNIIVNCGRVSGVKGSGGITVSIDCDKAEKKTHKFVKICDNEISCPNTPYAVYVSNVEDLEMKKNVLKSAETPVKRV